MCVCVCVCGLGIDVISVLPIFLFYNTDTSSHGSLVSIGRYYYSLTIGSFPLVQLMKNVKEYSYNSIL